MTSILYLSCSPRGADAHSARFAREVLDRLRGRHPDAALVMRDLAANPPSVPTPGFSAAILSGAASDDPALAESETLIGELEAADAVLIATPMHNFGVPAVLKAWVDQIVRIRRTFQSTPAGKVGTLRDRPVYIVVAAGGWFTGPTPTGAPAQPDFVVPYLRAVLNTIGIYSIHVFALEGMTRGAEQAESALYRARDSLRQRLG